MKDLRKPGKPAILPCSCCTIEAQHTACATYFGRGLGDQFFREVEMKISDAHSSSLEAKATES